LSHPTRLSKAATLESGRENTPIKTQNLAVFTRALPTVLAKSVIWVLDVVGVGKEIRAFGAKE
jgi:hypothetical protein